ARALPCIPLCGARTFLRAALQRRRGGCLADSRLQFYVARRRLSSSRYLAGKEAAMKRRLYFLLPDVGSATATANDLLLARVDDRCMHFLARRRTDRGELHEASYLIKTDLRRGAGIGIGLGVLAGVVLGYMIVNYPPEGTHPGLACAGFRPRGGAVLGLWMGSMAAT